MIKDEIVYGRITFKENVCSRLYPIFTMNNSIEGKNQTNKMSKLSLIHKTNLIQFCKLGSILCPLLPPKLTTSRDIFI